MDHHLEDSLTLEGDIANMEFDHSGVAVNQEEITLETVQPGDIQMGLGHIEEQIIMDSGNEEVVVSDFINEDQFFQEYTIENSASNIKNAESIITQGGNIIQIHPVTTITSSAAPNFITVKTATAPKPVRRSKAAPMPRQVAIAPRPPHTPVNVQYATPQTPKPVALVMNTTAGAKQKVPLANLLQTGVKGNTVLAQIGKQLVMLPANQAQKIKVMGSDSGELAQLIPNNKGSKIVVTKLVQASGISGVKIGQTNSEGASKQIAPKLFTASPAPHARYVMQQKTVPLAGKINLAGTRAKVVLTSPVKQKVNVTSRKQVIAINAQSTPVNQGNLQTKKVYITKNPNQNIVLKTSTTKTNTQQVTLTTGQRTQLHPINVPGKGIQYIKLVTNQPQISKQLTKVKNVPKNYVLTDSKGNIIQMSSDKILSTQPPPLIVTTSTAQTKGTTKPPKKLVRIAPVGLKTVAKSAAPRSSQSLLAPITTTIIEPDLTDHEITPDVTETTVSLEEFNQMVEQSNLQSFTHETETHEDVGEETVHMDEVEENVDQMTRLQSVTTDGDSEETDEHQDMNVEPEEYVVEEIKPNVNEMSQFSIEFEDSMQRMEQDDADVANNETVSSTKQDDSLIVVPQTSNSKMLKRMLSDNTTVMEHNSNNNISAVSVEAEVVPYEAPYTPPPYMDHENNMIVSTGLEVRPRKACNCTKSQCLKLYCDCFANGEFCNNCNCNNCHNNLENEELRQKAIRACLERNPNAFRPKIGKGKATGADLIRRHNKGCNCKRSGCLKNYCECYEAKIACTSMCKCVGCRNVEATLVRRDQIRLREKLADSSFRPPIMSQTKQPCSFMTSEVIEAVCQCLVAAGGAGAGAGAGGGEPDDGGKGADVDPVQDVIEEFARCLQDIINASYQAL